MGSLGHEIYKTKFPYIKRQKNGRPFVIQRALEIQMPSTIGNPNTFGFRAPTL